jgi:hypothetical protein
VPVRVACLVPAAPALLPALTGGHVPEVAALRAAVARALEHLVGLDLVVVVAPRTSGTLAGFGAPGPIEPDPEAQAPPSWPHELATALLAGVPGAPPERLRWSWDDVDGHVGHRLGDWDALPGAVGLLLLADGSRTRGPRAPGGDDPRGAVVDSELVAALHERRAPDVPDAAAVGATAGPAVALLSLLGDTGARTEVLHSDAPLGVGYLVAVRRVPQRPRAEP